MLVIGQAELATFVIDVWLGIFLCVCIQFHPFFFMWADLLLYAVEYESDGLIMLALVQKSHCHLRIVCNFLSFWGGGGWKDNFIVMS